jgi:hypothetical protein
MILKFTSVIGEGAGEKPNPVTLWIPSESIKYIWCSDKVAKVVLNPDNTEWGVRVDSLLRGSLRRWEGQ